MISGFTSSISMRNHGMQAPISEGSGRLVQTPLAARFPLEVLHDVRDVDGRAIHSGRIERAVEQLSRGPDERPADDVLAVAGRFADEHDRARCASPSPNTVCVARRNRPQPRHSAAATRAAG